MPCILVTLAASEQAWQALNKRVAAEGPRKKQRVIKIPSETNLKTCVPPPAAPKAKFFICTVIFLKATRCANKYFKCQGAS